MREKKKKKTKELNTTEIKTIIIRKYYTKMYANSFNNVEIMNS